MIFTEVLIFFYVKYCIIIYSQAYLNKLNTIFSRNNTRKLNKKTNTCMIFNYLC